MALKFYNTLNRTLEAFVPLDPSGRRVGLYCCGPTVYDFAHIGNWRTFVFSDLVRRYLAFRGYKVTHVMNVTDIDDKIIRRVRETGKTLPEFTGVYEQAFFEDLTTLGCHKPHHTPHATAFMPQIIDLIARLLQRGIAYQTPDGTIWFSIEKYQKSGATYGQLVKLNFEEMRVGERVANDEYAKESVADFALWKARVPEDGAVFWASPWGDGRPGWHIECSAMSMDLLGPSFDLHLGGEDLVFPHHEDEIAQSEGAGLQTAGHRFVKYWLHGAHLLVEGKKMSKSLGNFFTLRDLVAKGFTGREIRYLLLTAHYRETFNFTLGGLGGAKSALARLDECVGKLKQRAAGASAEASPALIERFTAALDEDLNISGAWAAVFDWVRDCNTRLADGTLSATEAAAQLSAWQRLDEVLGMGAPPETEVPAEIQQLMLDRQAARAAKDFKRADILRDELKNRGWVIEDTPQGPKPKRIG
jgi:cysteinyl-tRNA synthetase